MDHFIFKNNWFQTLRPYCSPLHGQTGAKPGPSRRLRYFTTMRLPREPLCSTATRGNFYQSFYLSISTSIYLSFNLSLFQSISLSIYLYWFNWYCNCHWLVKRTKINKKGRRWSIIAITKDVLLQISVEEIRLHEGYNGNGDRSEGELISNDIALIRLAKPAELNPGIHWFKHALRYTHMQSATGHA